MSKAKYVGLDVHKATIVIVVLNAVGQVVMQTIIATDTQVIRDCFPGLSGTVRVALEEGTQSAWLSALLRPLVTEVVVCNPRYNKLIETGNNMAIMLTLNRDSFTDLIMTFPLLTDDEAARWNTDWPLKPLSPSVVPPWKLPK